MSLTATIASPITSLSIVRSDDQCFKFKRNVLFSPVGLKPLCVQFPPSERSSSVTLASRVKHPSSLCGTSQANHASLIYGGSPTKHSSFICAGALNATCSAEQTQTVTRQSSTITVAPVQGKEKSPELDDGGTGFPPRDDDDGGGGGGGGGGHWSGGFFFFGFLALLGLLKDQEEGDGSYQNQRRRR